MREPYSSTSTTTTTEHVGQAYDFSRAGEEASTASSSCGSNIRPASIEVASAEALRILQRHYGATTSAVHGAAHNRSGHAHHSGQSGDVECGGMRTRGLHASHVLGANDNPQLVMCVNHSVGFALIAPFVILGPWLNGMLGSLVSVLITDVQPVASATVTASANATQVAALRIGGILVTGGLFALMIKMLVTVPCIGYGGTLMDVVLPGRRRTAAAPSLLHADAGVQDCEATDAPPQSVQGSSALS